jgi:transglutaminase-like putative cysteine protease
VTLLVAQAPTPVRRSLLLEQSVRYDYAVPVSDLQQRLVIVPPAVHGGQRRGAWSLTASGDPSARPSRRRSHRDPFGNHVVEVDVPRVDGWVAFDCRVSVARDGPSAAGPHRVPADPRFLAPSLLTVPGDEVRDLVADLATSTSTSADVAADVAAEVCARTYRAFAYEWGITGVGTTAGEALRGGRGVCQDYAHVMIAACRVAGVAARYVSGHLVGEGGSHAWVEVLTPDPAEPGWCLVEAWDPTHDRRAGDGYLTVAVGRDYADVAPISGAYVADAPVGHLTVTKRLTTVP